LTARGNYGHTNYTNEIYPALYKDNWLISVGASGSNGQHLNANPESNNENGTGDETFRTSYGGDMDFIAPGTFDIIYTTIKTGYSNYAHFNGTSAALPHATGAAALLLMHSQDDLAQEDVEHLLEYSAVDIVNEPLDYSPGYDEYNGWGRLNAGQAIEMIDPNYDNLRVVHFDFEGEYQYEDLICYNEPECRFWLSDGYYDICENDMVPSVSSGVLRKVFISFSIPLDAQYDITPADLGSADKPAWWVRSAGANLWDEPVYNTTGDYYDINPGNQLFFEEGPVYEDGHLSGVIAGYQIILPHEYAPCTIPSGTPDPVVLPEYSTGPPRLGFSLLATTPANFEGPIIITAQKEPLIQKQTITAYPNPARNEITLSYRLTQASVISLNLFDTQGRLLQSLDMAQQAPGAHNIAIDLSALPIGLYYCAFQTAYSTQTAKLIKL
jgi:hypothetical protein